MRVEFLQRRFIRKAFIDWPLSKSTNGLAFPRIQRHWDALKVPAKLAYYRPSRGSKLKQCAFWWSRTIPI